MKTGYFSRSRPSWLRLPAWIVLAVSGALSLAIGNSMDATAADASVPVVLSGVGDFDIKGELVDWQNTLYGTDQPTDFVFTQRGSQLARSLLLKGLADFAVGGVPYTATELADRPAGSGAIIEVPLFASALAMILTTPNNGGWSTYKADLDCLANEPPDEEICITRGQFTDPIRIPPENLSAMIIGLSPDYQDNRLINWNNPDIEAALETKDLSIQGRAKRHSFLNRSEAASANKYLMTYAQALGPTAWDLRKRENPQFDWDALGEQFSSRTITRSGAETVLGAVAISRLDAVSGGQPDTWSGNMTALPSTYVAEYEDIYPAAGFRVAEIQNKHGDWVSPTKASIDAALAAGTTPDYAALNDVPDAYPLVYVNHLYTVAGTLTPDQANAMAASIRYIVTDGQQKVIDDGGSSLTPALQAEALVKADAIVAANCTAEGYEVTTSGPSVFEPNTPQVQTIASMAHCTLVPPPVVTTTTTEAATTTSTTEVAATSTTVAATTTTVAATTTTTVSVESQVPVVTTTEATTPSTTRPSAGASSQPSNFPAPTPPDTSPASTIVDESVPATTSTVAAEPATTVTPTTAAPAAGAGTRPRGVSLKALPMQRPSDGSNGPKQLGTVMLGAAMYLLGRKVYLAKRVIAS